MSLLDQLPLSPKQIQSIVESQNVRIGAWTGAVRSGKTIASLVSFLITVANAPRGPLLILSGRTLQTVERNLIEPLQDPNLFGPIAGHVRHTRGASIATILGRTVHLIGASDARAEGKLRGLTAYAIMLDECSLLSEEFVTQALARLSVPGARLILTTNPAGPRHWLRQKYLLRAGELDMGHWHFTLDDNPFLDSDYVTNIKAEMTGMWYRRNVLGEWVAGQGQVFDMFDEDRHILYGPLPRMIALPGVGVDYGAANPCAALILAVQAADRETGTVARLVLAREWRHDPRLTQRTLTVAEVSAQFGAWLGADRPEWIAVDPAAKAFRDQLWNDGHHNLAVTDNAVLPGLHLIAALLSVGRLVVHESCHGLLNEIPGYSWDETAAEKGEDKPIKVDDHSVDSAKYAIQSLQWIWRRYLPDVAAHLTN